MLLPQCCAVLLECLPRSFVCLSALFSYCTPAAALDVSMLCPTSYASYQPPSGQ